MARRKSTRAMPAEWLTELSDVSLHEMAGDAVFERGKAYFRDEAVELVRDGGTSATFEARGTQRYAVELYFEDLGLHVDCTCPHAQDGNFCKHMVAAALVWRRSFSGEDMNPGEDASAAAAAAPAKPTKPASTSATQARMTKAVQTRVAHTEALRSFLLQQSAPALAARLWELAQQHREVMADVKVWLASDAAAHDPKALRRAVEELLKISSRQYLEPAELRAWLRRTAKAATLLQQALAADAGLAAEVRAVTESALRQVLSVSTRAYDNPALAEGAMGTFMDVIVQTLRANPPPAAWAEHLLQRMQGEGGFAWQHPQVLEAAGPEVARAFSQRLAERWAAVDAAVEPGAPMDTADMGFRGDVLRFNSQRDQLRRWMVQDLERQGDPGAVLAFLKRTARGVMEHAALIQWCSGHARLREALQLARAACAQFKDNPRVEDLLLALYEQDGWDDEALVIRQRRFDTRPTPDHYLALVTAARRAKADLVVLRVRSHERARAVEQEELQRQAEQHRQFGPHWQPREPAGLNVTWRAGFHVLDGEFDAALQLVQAPHTCDPRVLEALAENLPPDRSGDAFDLLHRCFELEMARSKTPYKEPLRLLQKSLKCLRAPQARAHLLQVGQAHRAKRNFIAGLPQLGGPGPG